MSNIDNYIGLRKDAAQYKHLLIYSDQQAELYNRSTFLFSRARMPVLLLNQFGA
jgi:hypothetical protein